MSRIYFHSPSGCAELRGAERAYMSVTIAQLSTAFLQLREYPGQPSPFRKALPAGAYPLQAEIGSSLFERHVAMYMQGSGESTIIIDGSPSSVFAVGLNTALAVGDDPLRLMARLHGSCELHTWVDGPNRAWLADIIGRGRATGLYRADMGWEGVADMLRSRDDEPVVTSYSVCEQFPNRHTARDGGVWKGVSPDGDEDDGAWYDLPGEERWRLAMEGLRHLSAVPCGLEMKQEDWRDWRFEDKKTVFDIGHDPQAKAGASAASLGF
jgi:hypothetical protein